MNYKTQDFLSFKLHMIKTKKFKTITTRIIFSDKIKKNEITLKNFVSDMLTYSSKKYNTQKKLSTRLQDLYALNVFSNCYRIGNTYNLDLGISFLNEKYTEDGMLNESIDFLREIVLNPNIKSNEFDEVSFNIVKDAIRDQIESIKEDTRKLSLIKMLELMGSEEVYSFHGFGYKEDLEEITTKSLYEYYKNMLKTNKIDIFIIGDIDFSETEKIFEEKFKFNNKNNKRLDVLYNHKIIDNKVKLKEIKYPVSQAKLSIGCKIEKLSDYERNYSLTLFNIILGGNSDSKMFKNIREKNSLCYYISSVANKMDSILLITSGIENKNKDRVIELVNKEINNISNGIFEEEDIEKAKINYISILDEIEDNPYQIISCYYSMELLPIDNIETRKKMIKKVTKEDIINVSKKIKIDSICILGGDN